MNPPMPGLRLPIFEGMRKYSWLALPVAAGIGLLATRLVPGPRPDGTVVLPSGWRIHPAGRTTVRSEEHTSELQSQSNLVCRLLLEKKKNTTLPQSVHGVAI